MDREMRWRVWNRSFRVVPHDVRANAVHAPSPEPLRPKHPGRCQSIGSLVEPPPNRLPLQAPSSLCERAEGKLHLCLQE